MTWKFLSDQEREKIARKTPYVAEGLELHEQAVRELNPRDDWNGLTDDERNAIRDSMPVPFYVKGLYAAVEAKLKEKNK
jgi:predicted Fe-S protein YdhL (DUF1289 family)